MRLSLVLLIIALGSGAWSDCCVASDDEALPSFVSGASSLLFASSVMDAEDAAVHTKCGGGRCCCDTTCCYRGCFRFYGFAEAVFLDRSNNAGADQVVVIDEGALPLQSPLLTTDDLGFNAQTGVRFLLGYELTECHCCSAWEFGYLGTFNWNDSRRVAGNNNLAVAGDLGLVVNNFTGADELRLDYSSSLDSFEVNCVKCCSWCDQRLEWLVGFRYLALDEDLLLYSTDVQQGSTPYLIGTQNDLYGLQAGARFRRWRLGWLEWEATGKAGIYGNDVSQTQLIGLDFPPTSPVRGPVTANEGEVAFVGEISLTAIYPVGDWMAIRGGYNLLWIEGVALAPDQFDFSYTPSSGSSLTSNGGLFLHGVSVGLELYW